MLQCWLYLVPDEHHIKCKIQKKNILENKNKQITCNSGNMTLCSRISCPGSQHSGLVKLLHGLKLKARVFHALRFHLKDHEGTHLFQFLETGSTRACLWCDVKLRAICSRKKSCLFIKTSIRVTARFWFICI